LNVGGPAIHAINLTRYLNRPPFQSLLVAGKVPSHEGDMEYLAEEMGVKPMIVPEIGRQISPISDLIALYKLVRIINREKPHIVHSHTAKAGTLGRIASLLTGRGKRIHTFHGHIFHGYFSPLKSRFYILIEKILAVFTDRIVTVSPAVRNELVDRYKICQGRKCTVMELGFDLETFLKIDRRSNFVHKELGIPPYFLAVGMVGRLTHVKNPFLFINTARLVSEKLRNVCFVVVGSGELLDPLRDEVKRLNMDRRVFFLGWRRDLPEIYSSLDLVCLTSKNEGTPVSLIEAMASGIPVVSTNVGGVCDIVDEGVNGYLVEEDDVAGMADKIVVLLNDPDLRGEMGRRGREIVKERFSIERLVRDMGNFYLNLISR
ncbi:MAG: glycosyltransferase family 4 protein, partial [Fidelibacterota bacterium]